MTMAKSSDDGATVRSGVAATEGERALRYVLKDFGTSFATRSRGRELRDDLVARADGTAAVVDFADVTNVSYSFADEFVGKLTADGMVVECINMVPAVQRSVTRAADRRSGAPVGC
jgi:uncharacterized protein DUF4325